MCGIVAIYHPHGCVSAEALARGDRAAPPPRTRRPAALDRAARAGGARPCPPQHHRPGDGRSADRERGRAAADRRERRVLRLRADPARAGARGTPASDPLGQRDRAPPVRGPRSALPSPAPRRIRVRPVGRGAAAALRRARPIRDQAALLRVARRRALPRVRGEGAVRGRRAGPLESRGVVQRHGPGWPADRDAVRGRVAAAAGPLPARRPEWHADSPLLGLRLPAGGPSGRVALGRRVGRGVPSGARERGPASAARGRAGGLLSERRARLVRRARPRRSPRGRADPCLHARVRPGCLRRGGDRAGDGRPGQRRVLPHSHTAGRSGRRLRRRDLALGDVLPQRPRRREVRAEPSRAGRGLQGGAHRRRLRRDSRRLPPFPPGHAALRQRRPGPGGRSAR